MARDQELRVLTIAASMQHGTDYRGRDARFMGLLRRPFELCSLLRTDADLENSAERFRDTKNRTDRTVYAVKGVVQLLFIQMLHVHMADGTSLLVVTS